MIAHSPTKLMLEICDGIVEVIRAAGPLGCPGGAIYSVLMCHGCTLENFEKIMGALVAAGRLTKKGECYFAQ